MHKIILKSNFLLFTLFSIAVLFALQSNVFAVTGSTGAGSQNAGTALGGGGDPGGKAEWYDIKYDDKDNLYYNKSLIDRLREQSAGNKNKVSRTLTQRIDNCKSGSSKCTKWKNTKVRKTSKSSQQTYKNIVGGPVLNVRPVSRKVVAAWNVKIWREKPDTNSWQKVFERRISLQPGSRSSGPGTSSEAPYYWWYGGNTDKRRGKNGKGGTYSLSNQTSAGPLSVMTPDDRSNCVKRWRSRDNGTRDGWGKKGSSKKHGGRQASGIDSKRFNSSNSCYWEGRQIGPNSFSWKDPGNNAFAKKYFKVFNRKKGLPVTQFGDDDGRDKGIARAGLEEAIFIKWDTPIDNPRNGEPHIKVVIEGPPGIFYAVQITAVDVREELMPLKSPSARKKVDNHFFAFTNTGLPDVPPGGEDTVIEFDEPVVFTDLDSQDTLEVRQESEQIVTNETTEGFDAGQALFPTRTELVHFTPQMNFSDPSGEVPYSDAYVSYNGVDGENGTVSLRQSLFTHPNFSAEEVHIPVASWAGDLQSAGSILSENTFNITWLQPTLDNPCSIETPLPQAGNLNDWPKRPAYCNEEGIPGKQDSSNIANAWDDLLYAQSYWESQWVESTRTTDPYTVGYRQNELLRCPDKGKGALELSDCTQSKGYTTLLSNAFNREEQHAQGYVLAVNPKGEDDAEVHVQMKTNSPESVTSSRLIDRDTGEILPNESAPINTLSKQPELNYCQQGIPTQIGNEKVRINSGNPGASDDRLVKSSEQGDKDCQGYTVEWKWSNEGDVWANPDTCNASEGGDVPQVSGGNPTAAPSISGQYTTTTQDGDDTQGTRTKAYPNMPNNSAPYVGKRPGAGNLADCKEKVEGHYKEGRFVQTWAFKALPENQQNCTFTNADINKANNNRPRPLMTSEETGTRCSNGKKAFGFWYPTFSAWKWDGVCYPGAANPANTTRVQSTDLYKNRNSDENKSFSSAPTNNGYGRNPNNVVRQGEEQGDWRAALGQGWDCQATKEGFRTQGKWGVASQAGPGWGVNNSGPRIYTGAIDNRLSYERSLTADFTFSWATNSEAFETLTQEQSGPCPDMGVCWRLQADYDGYRYWNWYYNNTHNPVTPASSAYVEVFGPRNTR